MSELETLRRVERIARSVKLHTNSILSDRSARCPSCGEPQGPRGLQNEARGMLLKSLRELEGVFVELDMLRAGQKAS
jgi:hypothetical protein